MRLSEYSSVTLAIKIEVVVTCNRKSPTKMSSQLAENALGFAMVFFLFISLMSAKRENVEFFLVYLSLFVIIITVMALLCGMAATM